MGRDKQVAQKRFHPPQVGRDLLVAAAPVSAGRRQFKSIERALPGQRFAAIPLPDAIRSGRILFTDKHRDQQGSRVRRNGSAVKNPANFPPGKGLKLESICVTLPLHRVASCMHYNVLFANKLSHTRRPGAMPLVRNAG